MWSDGSSLFPTIYSGLSLPIPLKANLSSGASNATTVISVKIYNIFAHICSSSLVKGGPMSAADGMEASMVLYLLLM